VIFDPISYKDHVAEEAPRHGVGAEARVAVHRGVERRARRVVGAAARQRDLPPQVRGHGLEGRVPVLRRGDRFEPLHELAREVQQHVGDLGRVHAVRRRPAGGGVLGAQELGAAARWRPGRTAPVVAKVLNSWLSNLAFYVQKQAIAGYIGL